MLNTLRIQDALAGVTDGPWVQGAIAAKKVPRLSGELIAPNLSDAELMRLWGIFKEGRGWDSSDWREYLRDDQFSNFVEFRSWLRSRFGLR